LRVWPPMVRLMPLWEVWAKDVRDLTDIQERAVRTGALDGVTNLLVVAPKKRTLLSGASRPCRLAG
jgi:hypothetical protein